jgi:hypothetical protein
MPHATLMYSLYLVLNLLFLHVSNFRIWTEHTSKDYCEGNKLQLSTKKKGLNNVIL